MAVDVVPVPGESFERTLTVGAPDVVREMFRAFAQIVDLPSMAGRSWRKCWAAATGWHP